jgi:hypothetical protein
MCVVRCVVSGGYSHDASTPLHAEPGSKPLAARQPMTQSRRIEQQLALAFLPFDKRALGIAFGAASALLFAAVTALSLTLDPAGRFPLGLLREFFAYYSVSWMGAFVGAGWGFVVGFCWGWFFAFTRNLVLAFWLMVVRIRADISTSRDLLDHL